MSPPIPVRCLYCSAEFTIPAEDEDHIVRCPRGHFFAPAGTAPAGEGPTRAAPAPPVRRGTLSHLTAPHRCGNLSCPSPEINQAFGLRQHTLYHDECLRLTSLYAAVYFCPHCTPPTLLESPRWQWHQQTACPRCGRTLTVPDDDILRLPDPGQVEGQRFRFACPTCRRELECPVRHAGATVVCLCCLYAISVPRLGESVPAQPAPGPPPVATRACRNPVCGCRFPRSLSQCPSCGTRVGPL
jgi:hypothetical protein